MKKLSLVVATVLLCLTPLSLHSQRGLTLALDRAEARVGRPLTPGSVAGVHRRVHRRAAYGAAAYGAAAYGAAAYGAYAYHGHAGYRRHCTCY